jgi:hypothetical protein
MGCFDVTATWAVRVIIRVAEGPTSSVQPMADAASAAAKAMTIGFLFIGQNQLFPLEVWLLIFIRR